jgi:hypothetical protein
MNPVSISGVTENMKHTAILILLISLLLPLNAAAERLVREFSGDRTMQTAEFEVEAPWLIDWRVNSDYESSMGLTIVLLNEPSRTHAGTVMKTKYRGDGLRLMDEGGRFSFKVDSVLAEWTIKVIQLTPAEAKRYQPRNELDF